MRALTTHPAQTGTRPTLAVSACLIGERVRYDGGHKHDHLLTGTIATRFDLVPFCPEQGAGLGVPRPPIRLVAGDGAPRAHAAGPAGGDVTALLEGYARDLDATLTTVDGVVLKAGSPSCGPNDVPVFPADADRSAPPADHGAGIVAAWIRRHHPLLPTIDEARLGSPPWREAFLTAAQIHRGWREQVAARPSPAALVAFHAAHKLVVLAHHQAHYRRMGPLVAQAGLGPIGATCDRYARLLMDALSHPATAGGHVNVLHHLTGYLKAHIDADDRAELLAAIDAFRAGGLPLAAPVALLNHHFRRHPHPHAAAQFYLHRPWWP